MMSLVKGKVATHFLKLVANPILFCYNKMLCLFPKNDYEQNFHTCQLHGGQ